MPATPVPPTQPSETGEEDALFTTGSTWRRIGDTSTVEITRRVPTKDGFLIEVKSKRDPFPVLMVPGDFTNAYSRLDSEDPLPEVVEGEEWKTTSGVYVTVHRINEKRRTVTVRLADGRTETIPHRDFDNMQRVVRRSAYARLKG